MGGWLSSTQWGIQSKERLFPTDIGMRPAALMRIAAAEHHMNAELIDAHSIRSGWADAMSVAGYYEDVIRRCGGRRPDSFMGYIWNDDRSHSLVGVGMLGETGISNQLRRKSTGDMIKEALRPDGERRGKSNTHQRKGSQK